MRLWVHIDWYQMVWEPAMADTTQRRRIRDAYLHPMWRRDNTLSLGGYQLPREPTMKGKTSTLVYLCRRVCRRGWYFSTLERAASSRAVGEPSNGQQTSTMNAEDSSGEMMVRSGLLAPDVPGRGCSFIFVPICSGTALTILSKMELCLSLTIPRL